MMPETVRVFLSANYRDMQAEREFLHASVFPRVEKWFAEKHRITIEFLDVGRYLREGFADLKIALDSVERCRPYFLCLLGQRYGEGLISIPKDAVTAYPWLEKARKGMSRLHLEIMHAVLNNPAKWGKSFFYLREPSYLEHVPEALRGEYQASSPQEQARIDYVIKTVRASGRPVQDYSCDWNSQQGRLFGFTELGRMIANDLDSAITGNRFPALGATLFPSDQPETITQGKLEKVRGPRVEITSPRGPEEKPIVDENVQFTVYRPKVVRPDEWCHLLAFAHLSEKSADAPANAPDPVEEVERIAKGELGDEAEAHQKTTQDSEAAVPRHGQLTFVPVLDSFTFNPPRLTITWKESVHRAFFRMRASAHLDGQIVRGKLVVFLGAFIIADVPLVIKVDRHHVPPAKPTEGMEPVRARRYHKVFASYSHEDLDIVKQVEALASSLGFIFLRDKKDLRAGQKWERELMRMIEEADIFQLFWSRNSMTSTFVQNEWEYALSLDRADFVRPTYWEEPMPTSEQPPLPPPALAELHFESIATSVLSVGPIEGAALEIVDAPGMNIPGDLMAETAEPDDDWPKAEHPHDAVNLDEGIIMKRSDRALAPMPSPRSAGGGFVRIVFGMVLGITMAAGGLVAAWHYSPDELLSALAQIPNAKPRDVGRPSIISKEAEVSIVGVHDVREKDGAGSATLEFEHEIPNEAAILRSTSVGKHGFLRLLPVPKIEAGEPTKKLVAEWNQAADVFAARELQGKAGQVVYFRK